MSHRRLISLLLLIFLIVAGIAVFSFAKDLQPQQLLDLLNRYLQPDNLTTILLFMLFYCIASLVFFPATLITLSGGAFFGPWFGALYSLTGATAGAVLAFVISRYLSSDWIRQQTGNRLDKLQDDVAREGWRFVAFVRLVPIFPFSLLNYALGLTQIRISHYALATFIFMMPGGFAYAYLGHLGQAAFTGEQQIIEKTLIALTLFACLLYLPRLARLIRNHKADTE